MNRHRCLLPLTGGSSIPASEFTVHGPGQSLGPGLGPADHAAIRQSARGPQLRPSPQLHQPPLRGAATLPSLTQLCSPLLGAVRVPPHLLFTVMNVFIPSPLMIFKCWCETFSETNKTQIVATVRPRLVLGRLPSGMILSIPKALSRRHLCSASVSGDRQRREAGV